MTTREAYLRALSGVYTKGVDDLTTLPELFPHMTVDAVKQALDKHLRVALPGAYVYGTVWTAYVKPNDSGRIHVRAQRSQTSYISPRATHGRFDRDSSLPKNWQRAAAYARGEWDDHLLSDTCPSAMRFVLCDVTQPPGSRTVRDAAALLTRVLADFTSSSAVTELDAALHHPTTDPIMGAELRGGEPELGQFCWLCGAKLDTRGCRNCPENRNPAGDQTLKWGSVPMPPTIIQAFEDAGHTFEKNPRQWLAAA